VTVGVATCGRPAALGRCLQALAQGDGLPAQVVVVDQAPSDEAKVVVERSGLPGAAYVPQTRLGLSASRNLALRTASQSVLAVTDDDCVPERDWISNLWVALTRDPVPGAVTGAILSLGSQPPRTFAVSLRDSPHPIDYVGRVSPWITGSGANFAARCDVLKSLGGWDERLGVGSTGKAAEDADLLYRLLRSGRIVRYEPAAIVRHEWQSREHRLATRWTYGYGVGALCGIWLRRGDGFAPQMILGYTRLHARPLVAALARADAERTSQHSRALLSLVPGLLYGVLARSQQK